MIGDGRRVRVLGGSVLLGDEVVAEGREVTQDVVTAQLDAAHAGLSTQLQTLTHSSAEFVRREEPLLLHGQGLPRLRTKIKGRPVVVVGQGPDDAAELRTHASLPARDAPGRDRHRRGPRGGAGRRASRPTSWCSTRGPRSCPRPAGSAPPATWS